MPTVIQSKRPPRNERVRQQRFTVLNRETLHPDGIPVQRLGLPALVGWQAVDGRSVDCPPGPLLLRHRRPPLRPTQVVLLTAMRFSPRPTDWPLRRSYVPAGSGSWRSLPPYSASSWALRHGLESAARREPRRAPGRPWRNHRRLRHDRSGSRRLVGVIADFPDRHCRNPLPSPKRSPPVPIAFRRSMKVG
jgi:hypothetical protein